MKIGVPKEIAPGECRVALTPDVVGRLVAGGSEVVAEAGAGAQARFADEAYVAAGAMVADAESAWSADVVAKVSPPLEVELSYVDQSTVLVGFLAPLTQPQLITSLTEKGATAFALESIPRISRAQSMDALSSQATVSGYYSVLIGASKLGRFFPMLMTAAGTIPPAQVLVLGAGVAGLQAIATARRLGAVVTAFDVRSSVKEQIESLGAKFLQLEAGKGAEGEGGYARALTEEEKAAQQDELSKHIARFDIVISTALVPGKPAPRLITAKAVEMLKPGSVVVDLAGEAGGNCERSVPGETIVTENSVTIAAPLNLPSAMAEHASQMFAKNIEAFLQLVKGESGELAIDFEDEVLAGACVTNRGETSQAEPLKTGN